MRNDEIITYVKAMTTDFTYDMIYMFCLMALVFLIFVWIYMIYDAIKFTYDHEYNDKSKKTIQAYVETIILLTLELVITVVAIVSGFSILWLIILGIFIIISVIIYFINK
jgi:uncharacterized sodium:solute symporter family permease YidK